MTWVVEEPLYIAILGVITLAFVGFAWMQTGYRSLLHAAIGIAALTAGLLLLEHLVVTEPEAIEATVLQIGRDVERNDREKVYSHVYSGAPQTLELARREFPRWKFERVSIKRNLQCVLDPAADPPSAEVTFNVVVEVQQITTSIKERAAVFVELKMCKEGGQWKVADYSYQDAATGMRRRVPR